MKEKLFNALKTEYATLGFSDKAISGVAESLASTGLVTDENLDSIVQGQKKLLASFQSEIDSRVTSAREKALSEPKQGAKSNGGGEPTEPKTATSDDIKAMIEAAVAEKVTPLQEKLQQYERKEMATERQTMIAAKAKELGIDQKCLQFLHVPDELDEDGVTQHLTAYKQYEVDRGLPTLSPFPKSEGKVTKEETDLIVEGMGI